MSFASSSISGRLVHLHDLVPLPNHSIHKTQINKMVNHMKNGGLLPPIVVQQGTNIVIDGNARLRANEKIGKQRIRAIYN